jgi:hypothetical protein
VNAKVESGTLGTTRTDCPRYHSLFKGAGKSLANIVFSNQQRTPAYLHMSITVLASKVRGRPSVKIRLANTHWFSQSFDDVHVAQISDVVGMKHHNGHHNGARRSFPFQLHYQPEKLAAQRFARFSPTMFHLLVYNSSSHALSTLIHNHLQHPLAALYINPTILSVLISLVPSKIAEIVQSVSYHSKHLSGLYKPQVNRP